MGIGGDIDVGEAVTISLVAVLINDRPSRHPLETKLIAESV